jgi:hypothetical protein
VHQAGGDRDIPDPLLFQVQRDRLAVHPMLAIRPPGRASSKEAGTRISGSATLPRPSVRDRGRRGLAWARSFHYQPRQEGWLTAGPRSIASGLKVIAGAHDAKVEPWLTA